MSFQLQMFLDGVDLEILPEVESFWYDETIYGASVYCLHATSADWEKWDKLATSTSSRVVKLRWGFREGLTERWASWKDVLLTPARYRLASGVVEIWIDSTDAGYKLAEISHGLPFVSKRVSDMVQKIATVNQFRSRIEKTAGLFTFYQGRLSDATFIQEVLLNHAVSGSGKPDYHFYIEDGKTLVFEPADLSRVYDTYPVRSSANEATERDIEVLEVAQRRFFQAAEGSAVNEVRGFSSLRKTPIHVTVSDDSVDLQYMAKRRPEVPAGPSAIQLTTEGTEESISLNGRATWGANARGLYRTEVELSGYDMNARPGRVVELAVFTPTSQVHWTAGRWLVWKVRQWLSAKGYGTRLYLERRSHE